MTRRRSNPQRVRALHHRKVEAAVRQHAPPLWAATRRLHARWLRIMLAAAGPLYKQLVLEARLHDFEIAWLTAELEKHGHDITPADLLDLTEVKTVTTQLATSAAQRGGFLERDPRTRRLEAEAKSMLESDVSSYWRTLTDPETLAKRLVRQKADGVPYVEAARQISREYGAEFYRAERLVRSSYSTASNNAALAAIEQAGFPNKQWLTSRDARVRRPTPSSPFDHQSADGQVVGAREPFTVSGEELMFPGDTSKGASISNVVNCRCTVLGVD